MKVILFVIALVLVLIVIDEGLEKRHLQRLRKTPISWEEESVAIGKQRASESRINFCFLARDCEASVNENKPVIENWGKLFKDYRVIAFENDSKDKTRQVLKDWAETNPKVHLISCMEDEECSLRHKHTYEIGQHSKKRIERMGEYRERYLDYLRQLQDPFELTMVIDIDLAIGNAQKEGLLSALAISYEWDAIFHNGRISVPGTFGTVTCPYDSLAFQDIDYKQSDTPRIIQVAKTKARMYAAYNQEEKFVPVKSAFNGLALYKTAKMLEGTYKNDGQPVCEHCVLHDSLDKKYASREWLGYYLKQGHGSSLNQIKDMVIESKLINARRSLYK